jgi:hypothetical protein
VPSTLGIVASTWTPLKLSPALWLDAADASTITASGSPLRVSQWNDKSGNGRNVTQGTGSSQPAIGLTTQNGLNTLTFDGNDSLLSAAFNVPNSTFSAYAVVSETNSGGSRFIFEQSNDFFGRRFLWRNSNRQLVFGYHDGATFRDYLKPWVFSSGTHFIVSGVMDSSDVVRTISGTSDTVSARTGLPQAGSRTLRVGQSWIGTIAELLIFDGDHDAPTRALVHGYLSTKWGITL